MKKEVKTCPDRNMYLLTNRRQKKKKGQKSEFEAELGESGPVCGKDVLLMQCARTAKNVT